MSTSSPVPHDDLDLVRRALEGDGVAVERVVERMRCAYRALAQGNRRPSAAISSIDDVDQSDARIGTLRAQSLVPGRCAAVTPAALTSQALG